MMYRTLILSLSAAALFAFGATAPAAAGDFTPARPICGGGSGYGHGGSNSIVNNFNFDRSFNYSNNIEINKNFDFSRHITINKSFDFSKRIDIEKNFDLSKMIIIDKDIDINIAAQAQAFAGAGARAGAMVFVGGGGSSYVNVTQSGGGFGALTVEEPCIEQWAQVVSSIHAECIDARGGVHPATRMIAETWVDSSMDKEIYRCLAGSILHVTIGDVVQSDHGLAGIYEGGQVFSCAAGEALRHYTNGVVRCAVADRVPDCTERENMRRYGTGDLFFSCMARVCAAPAASSRNYSEAATTTEFSSTGFSGGVGGGGY
jgi:hypothetical protein